MQPAVMIMCGVILVESLLLKLAVLTYGNGIEVTPCSITVAVVIIISACRNNRWVYHQRHHYIPMVRAKYPTNFFAWS
jgi:hypothetical protein